MLTIRDRSKVPNGLYTYTVAETQAEFAAHSFGLLVVKVRKHLSANNLPIPENLSDVVEQDWCSRRPEHCQDPDEAVVLRKKEDSDLFTQVIAAAAIPAADALATISKALGIHCSGCQKRHRIVREMRKRGLAETVRLLKETLA